MGIRVRIDLQCPLISYTEEDLRAPFRTRERSSVYTDCRAWDRSSVFTDCHARWLLIGFSFRINSDSSHYKRCDKIKPPSYSGPHRPFRCCVYSPTMSPYEREKIRWAVKMFCINQLVSTSGVFNSPVDPPA